MKCWQREHALDDALGGLTEHRFRMRCPQAAHARAQLLFGPKLQIGQRGGVEQIHGTLLSRSAVESQDCLNYGSNGRGVRGA